MQINLTIFATGATIVNNNLRYKASQTDSPGAIIAIVDEAPPHSFPHSLTITVPNPVPHIVQIFSSPDSSDGLLVASFMYDPSYKNIEIRIPLELAVGGSGPYDPIDGTNTTPVLPDMDGWDWRPSVRGMGGQLNATEYSFTFSSPGIKDGFQLTNGQVFTAPDYVFINFLPKISTVTPNFSYQDLYTDIITLDGTGSPYTMDASWLHKVVEINTAGVAPVINLLALADIPNNSILTFSTMLGAQKGATINTNGSEIIFSPIGNIGSAFLGERDFIQIMRRSNGFHVVNNWEGMARTGIQTEVEIDRPNIIRFNGGGLLSGTNPAPIPRALYPRAEWYVMTQLSIIYTKADRDAGGIDLSGYWAYDDDYLYAPDYRGTVKRALDSGRGLDTTRNSSAIPGSYRADLLKKHKHYVAANTKISSSGTFPGQADENTQIAAQLDFNNNTGGASTFFAATNIAASVGLTSEGGDGNETVPKTVGVIAGCYI